MAEFDPEKFMAALKRTLPEGTEITCRKPTAQDRLNRILAVNAWYDGAGKNHRWQRGDSFTSLTEAVDMKIKTHEAHYD